MRFRGHFPKGGYDVQNGSKQHGTTRATTVYGGVPDRRVRLVLDEEKTVGAVARELDLTPSSLGKWVSQVRTPPAAGTGIPFSPATGHLLIFPAWLEHRVEPFEGAGERISIAFNAINP
jgi:hypothetical protein